MYTKILLATDGSEHSLKAAKEAVKLAKLTKGALLEVVFVIDTSIAYYEAAASWENFEEAQKESAEMEKIKEIAEKENVNYLLTYLRGNPALELVTHANKNGFDLLVIGNRGLNAVQEFMLGSVSHKVIKKVKCPVLVIK